MTKTQLLERSTSSLPNTAAPPAGKKRDYAELLIFLIVGSLVTALFIKLIDYEMSQDFKWLNRPVDAAWY